MSNSVKGKQSQDKFFTIEFFGVTVILSSFLLLVCLFFGKSVLFEIGFDQGDSLRELAKKYNFACDIIKDYSGNDRGAYIKK